MQLYRDCLRLADYISTKVRPLICSFPLQYADNECRIKINRSLFFKQGGNREILRRQVIDAFRRNKDETDPKKIEDQKQA
jgi:hypothetical protein